MPYKPFREPVWTVGVENETFDRGRIQKLLTEEANILREITVDIGPIRFKVGEAMKREAREQVRHAIYKFIQETGPVKYQRLRKWMKTGDGRLPYKQRVTRVKPAIPRPLELKLKKDTEK